MAGHDSSVMVCETGPGHDGSGMQEVEQDASQRGSAGHGLLQQPGGSLSSSAPAITLPTDHSSLAKHLKELDAKQDQLKTLLSRTRSLLFGFHQQCKTNPSSEVEGLKRFHEDRETQIQVELRACRRKKKAMQRANLTALRARSSFVRSTQPATSTLEDLLDQSILVNIFPLIAAYNGERARNIPQVCKHWRECFNATKMDWVKFAITRPISNCHALHRLLDGADHLVSLSLVFDEATPVHTADFEGISTSP
ncbi:hypothetical protein T484DRAFT_1764839 [Baffinella frigidus]|nr:hypothetical protein T484DRAFT_1764839 [Cryptophyta sp. CCMP2293]